MTKEEFIKEHGLDLTELKITGVLNAERYKKMDEYALKEFIGRDVKERAQKFVHPDWTDTVNVRCGYVVLDYKYNLVDTVNAASEYSHFYGVSGVIILPKE